MTLENVKKISDIGTGSFGKVYQVEVQGTICAAKEIKDMFENHKDRRAEFLKECLQSCRLFHPNIVQYLGIYFPPCSNDGLPWLVMELMYISLSDLIKKHQKEELLLKFKLPILLNICEGIQFLHGRDLVHRDLTSHNVLLTKYFVAKIGDFGTAKVIKSSFGTHTRDPGTPNFMPPEAKSKVAIYNSSIDIFSFGCVCLHTISLEWPLPIEDARTEVEKRKKYMKNELCTCKELKELVENCLSDKAENRPKIEEVTEQLKKIMDRDNNIPECEDIIGMLKKANSSNSQQRYESNCKIC